MKCEQLKGYDVLIRMQKSWVEYGTDYERSARPGAMTSGLERKSRTRQIMRALARGAPSRRTAPRRTRSTRVSGRCTGIGTALVPPGPFETVSRVHRLDDGEVIHMRILEFIGEGVLQEFFLVTAAVFSGSCHWGRRSP